MIFGFGVVCRSPPPPPPPGLWLGGGMLGAEPSGFGTFLPLEDLELVSRLTVFAVRSPSPGM